MSELGKRSRRGIIVDPLHRKTKLRVRLVKPRGVLLHVEIADFEICVRTCATRSPRHTRARDLKRSYMLIEKNARGAFNDQTRPKTAHSHHEGGFAGSDAHPRPAAPLIVRIHKPSSSGQIITQSKEKKHIKHVNMWTAGVTAGQV